MLLLALVLVGAWVASLGADPTESRSQEEPDPGAWVAAGDGSISLPPEDAADAGGRTVLTTKTEATRAAVWAETTALVRPRDGARKVASVQVKTPEDTDNIVLALEERADEAGQLWVRVRLATRPNGLVGWVPRTSLGPYETLRTRLVVDRATLVATLWRNGERVFRAPIGIGTRDAPTPSGRFYVRNKLTKYSNEFYGPIAFGTSATSPTLTDWPAGGFVGIHGTNRPDLLPGRVSHGCIRMENEDILRLARLMPPGTPVDIT